MKAREGAKAQVLPAHAGMIPLHFLPSISAISAPRACGDDPAKAKEGAEVEPCSPRMRG